jgi:mono/diheme cytochrome c family protein
MRHVSSLRAAVTLATVLGAGCAARRADPAPFPALPVHGESGPAVEGDRRPFIRGEAARGRDVYRYETFGNERFWTDALRLPQGIIAERITPLGLLELGMHIDIEHVEEGLREDITAQFKTDLSKEKAPLLHDPDVTIKLIEANAVSGFAAKDTDGDGKIDLRGNDKMGISCAICHTAADGSVYQMSGNRGAVGKRLDGLGTWSLDMGGIIATGLNSRAFYPNLQLELGGKTIGRAPRGIRRDSSEAEVDAYLRNKDYYPRGTFDETNDGVGNSVQNTPLFRQDLAAPYGTAGEFERLEDISSASFSQNLDPTSLVTPPGRTFLLLRGGPLGKELADNYEAILKETGVTGYPFVRVTETGLPPGNATSPTGRRVDAGRLADMNAYLADLPIPQGADVDRAAAARGKEVFVSQRCIDCHETDPEKPLPYTLVDLETLWPAYKPEVLGYRMPPFAPLANSPGVYDDKLVVVDASDRSARRGIPTPFLVDLARKPFFLHDASVPTMEALFDPGRGSQEPHPFYVDDRADRADLITFLQGRGGPGVKPPPR